MNCRKLPEVSRFCTTSLTKGNARKMQVKNYFYFNSFISFFETILLIWLSPLVSGVPILYPQYNLILSI